jgi:hypothetical protein
MLPGENAARQISPFGSAQLAAAEHARAAQIGGYFSRSHEPAARRGTDRHAM